MEQRMVSSNPDLAPQSRSEVAVGTAARVSVFMSRAIGGAIAVFKRLRRARAGDHARFERRIEEIGEELEIERRARVDGENEIPPATEERLCGTQRDIVAYCKTLHRKATQKVAASIERIRGHIERIELSESLRALRDLPARCENSILRLNADHHSRIAVLEEREAQLRRHITTFRETNGLDRSADYPRARLLHLALAAVLIGIGTVFLRQWLPQQTPDGGFSGGYLAPSIALLCILGPFVSGTTAFRHTNHARGSHRFGGWVCTVITFALLLSVAYSAALFSTRAESGAASDIGSFIRLVQANLVAIDFASVFSPLFASIVAGGVLAFLIGYKSDDPYPAYGGIQRAYDAARRRRDAASGRLRRRVNEIIDAATGEAHRSSEMLKTSGRELAAVVERSRKELASLRRSAQESEEICSSLLDAYRDINAGTRDSEAPPCFGIYASFQEDVESMASELADVQSGAERLILDVRGFDEEVSKVLDQLKDLNWNAINSLISQPDEDGAS